MFLYSIVAVVVPCHRKGLPMIKLAYAAGILMATSFLAEAIDLTPKTDRLQVVFKTCYVESSTLADFLVPDLQRGIKISSKSRIKYIIKQGEGSPE